jgi:hypothetical protein
MTDPLRVFVDAWRVAGPELEALRDRDLRDLPLPEALAQLEGMVESALFLYPPEPWSGLIEMQAVFARLRP